MSAAAERTNPDVDLLVACEAFHAAHRDMKAGRGDTPEAEAAIGWAIDDWYAAIAAVRAIRAHTPAGQQAKARVAHTALHDVLPIEEEEGHREEFFALSVLAELLGTTAALPTAADAPATPTDAPAAQNDIEALLVAAEDADGVFYDLESVFLDMRVEIDIIKHVARTEAEVSVDVWSASTTISTSRSTRWKAPGSWPKSAGTRCAMPSRPNGPRARRWSVPGSRTRNRAARQTSRTPGGCGPSCRTSAGWS